MKETNMEHYRGEIEKNEYSVAVVNGELAKCCDTNCERCDFTTTRCVRAKIKWLMSEYKPEPVLTAREKHFVEFVETGWIARDESGRLWWHKINPEKRGFGWVSNLNASSLDTEIFSLNKSFNFITWEDEEPWAVEDLRELKVTGDTNG